ERAEAVLLAPRGRRGVAVGEAVQEHPVGDRALGRLDPEPDGQTRPHLHEGRAPQLAPRLDHRDAGRSRLRRFGPNRQNDEESPDAKRGREPPAGDYMRVHSSHPPPRVHAAEQTGHRPRRRGDENLAVTLCRRGPVHRRVRHTDSRFTTPSSPGVSQHPDGCFPWPNLTAFSLANPSPWDRPSPPTAISPARHCRILPHSEVAFLLRNLFGSHPRLGRSTTSRASDWAFASSRPRTTETNDLPCHSLRPRNQAARGRSLHALSPRQYAVESNHIPGCSAASPIRGFAFNTSFTRSTFPRTTAEKKSRGSV